MSTPIESLNPNPGGTLAPDQVIGRDELIDRYWDILQTRSIALLAPRRIGKTSLCRRLEAHPPRDFLPRMSDLQGKATAQEFVEHLLDEVEGFLSTSQRAARKARAFLERVTGSVQIKDYRIELTEEDWRTLLDKVFEDLAEWAEENRVRPVLVWDEFTLFLSDLDQSGRAREAMALLDRLRAIRQRHRQVRMILTGSIGLDEVIRNLKRQGYANDPVNDMAKEIVPPLELDGATDLARLLLKRVAPDHTAAEQLSAHIARICEGHPFLIQHVAEHLKYTPIRDVNTADRALESLIDDDRDPLELSHYIERLQRYLDDADRRATLAVLDYLATAAPSTVGGLSEALPDLDRETLLDALRVLRRDLYLTRESGRFRFRLAFLRRYWRLERGL